MSKKKFHTAEEKDLLNVANDDTLGRKLQDAKILVKKRAPKLKNL